MRVATGQASTAPAASKRSRPHKIKPPRRPNVSSRLLPNVHGPRRQKKILRCGPLTIAESRRPKPFRRFETKIAQVPRQPPKARQPRVRRVGAGPQERIPPLPRRKPNRLDEAPQKMLLASRRSVRGGKRKLSRPAKQLLVVRMPRPRAAPRNQNERRLRVVKRNARPQLRAGPRPFSAGNQLPGPARVLQLAHQRTPRKRRIRKRNPAIRLSRDPAVG